MQEAQAAMERLSVRPIDAAQSAGQPTGSVTSQCAHCGKEALTQACGRCMTARYCGKACQKAAWPAHKAQCVKPIAFNADKCYPVLAALGQIANLQLPGGHNPAALLRVKGLHKRGTEIHVTLDGPGPTPSSSSSSSSSSSASDTNQGLGPALSQAAMMAGMERFMGSMARLKLPAPAMKKHMLQMRTDHGHVAAMCVSLLLSLHSALKLENLRIAEADAAANRTRPSPAVRLAIHDSVAADYGVCCGRFTRPDWHYVYHYSNGVTAVNNHPDRHCWMYFQTTSGTEVTFDCCVYPFNFLMGVHEPMKHLAPETLRWLGHTSSATTGPVAAPAFYYSRTLQGQVSSAVGAQMYEVQQRHSFKDLPTLEPTTRRSSGGFPIGVVSAVTNILQQLLGPERYSQAELEQCLEWCQPMHGAFQELLETGKFKTYPSAQERMVLLDGGCQ